MVELGRVSRSGFYRSASEAKPKAETDVELRNVIQRIALPLCSALVFSLSAFADQIAPAFRVDQDW